MKTDEISVCPICHEDAAYVETEGDWCTYVQCAVCGSHTASMAYQNDQEKEKATTTVIRIWNMGKVIAERNGE